MLRRLAVALIAATAATATANQLLRPSSPHSSGGSSPEAFKAAARALLQKSVGQVAKQRRLLESDSGSSSSPAALTTAALHDSISNVLETLEGSSASDLFKQLPIVGAVLSPSSSSSSSSTTGDAASGNATSDFGSLLDQLLVARETNFNLYDGLQDVEAAWKAVPVLGGVMPTLSAGSSGSSSSPATVSLTSARGSGLFGIRGIIESLASEAGLKQLSAVDLNALDGAAAGGGEEETSAISPLFFGGKFLSILAPAVSSAAGTSDSDQKLIAMAPEEEQKVAQAMDIAYGLQGTLMQLIHMFTAGVMFPFRLAAETIRNAVNVIMNAPYVLGSYSVLGRALSELLLDVRGVAYGYDMSARQSGILGNLMDTVTNFMDFLGQMTSDVLNRGFFETMNHYLTELGQWLVDFDAEPIYGRLRNAGLDMSFSIANRGALMAQTGFQTNFPFITNAFGLTVQVIGNLVAGGAQLWLNFAGFGLNAFLAVTRPFFRLARTGLDMFRSVLQLTFIRIPMMVMDALGLTALLRAMQQTFRNAVGAIAGFSESAGASLPGDFEGLDGLMTTDFIESLLNQGTASTVDDTVTALVKSVTMQEGLDLSSQMNDVLSGSASRVTEVLAWPLNLLGDFMTAGMTTVLGTVTSIVSNAGIIGINGSSGILSLLTGGIFSTTPNNWLPGNYNNNGLFGGLLGGGGRSRRLLQEVAPMLLTAAQPNVTAAEGAADDAVAPAEEEQPGSPQAAALEVAVSGVVMVLEAVAEIGEADLPCKAASNLATELFNAAAIGGNPARLLQAVGVDEESAKEILALAPSALAAAGDAANDAAAAVTEPVPITDLCEAKRAALKALGVWARAGVERMEKFVQSAKSRDVVTVNAAVDALVSL